MISTLAGVKSIPQVPNSFFSFNVAKPEPAYNPKLFSSAFINYIGQYQHHHIINKPYLWIVEEIKYQTEAEALITKMFGELSHLVNFLWFSKDNSISLLSLYFYSHAGEYMHLKDNLFRYSSCVGEYEECDLTAEDLRLANEIYSKMIEIITPYKSKLPEMKEIKIGANPSRYNYLAYNQLTRIERALNFLNIARTQDYLPMKLTMYACVIESLFSTDKQEVGHKISERAAVYLKGESNVMLENYKIFKRMYDYRSQFVHGSEFKIDTDAHKILAELSQRIDELIRQILLKIILKDSKTFTKNQKQLNDFFTELIFER